MTIIVRTENRILIIHDAYAVALSFLISFAVTKIVKSVIKKLIEKQKQKNAENTNIIDPRGGSFGLEFSDNTELAYTILACIADNQRYLVKDPEVIEIVFRLVKAKIKNESLALTPNMMRFLALKLINKDQTLIVKIGNILMSSRTQARVFGATIIGLLGAAFSTLPYALLLVIIHFSITEDCGYKCSDYFEQLSEKGPVEICVKESTGNLVIAGNDDARQIELYNPSKAADEVTVISDRQLKTTRTCTKVRKKARQVNFSDFKKTDPVLSRFKDLEEPKIAQKTCPINDIRDIDNIRID